MNTRPRYLHYWLLAACCGILCLGANTSGQAPQDREFVAAMREARRFDPMYGKSHEINREKAVAMYNKALRLRSQHPRNIEIEHRIAQLYAFYGNPKTGEPSPYVTLRERIRAKIVRPVYYELVGMGLEETVDNEKVYGVWSSGAFFPIGTVDPDG